MYKMNAKKSISLALLVACLIVANVKCTAQDTLKNQDWNQDQLFSVKGKSSILLATGIPYGGAIEYSHGFTDKFSVGVFYGKNAVPEVYAVGTRIRGVFYSSENNFRIYGELAAN